MCLVLQKPRGAARSRGSGEMLVLTLVAVYSLYVASGARGELAMLAPELLQEPAPRVQYAARAGTALHCVARALPPPHVSWLAEDGSTLQDQPGLRRIYSNGTLEMLPSSAYEVTPATVRCRAANVHGVTVSRDVTLVPVPDESWEAVASTAAAAPGGVAAITCASAGARDPTHVLAALWYRGDTVLHLDPPSPESRYLVAGNTLLIRDVSSSDAGAYSCLARHAVTGATRRARPALLSVGENQRKTTTTCCFAIWYREREGRLQPALADSWAWAGGAAQCVRRASPAAAGLWICKAYNVYGDATAHSTLHVLDDSLSVLVVPTVLVADAGSTAHFNCSASDPRASLSWLHNGAPVSAVADGGAGGGGSAVLVLRGVARAHRGVYQCVARLASLSAQAAAELRLGGKYFINEETSVTGDVVSTLNVSAVSAADGGRYTCRAYNALGHARHSARLNIYGPPSIRALGPVRVVAGANATIYCPYAGYPIRSIEWLERLFEKAKRVREPFSPRSRDDGSGYRKRGSTFGKQGSSQFNQNQTQHTARCIPHPPKISPFMFSSELTEGSSVQVLCGVSSGDKPMYFTWLKDGAPLPANLQIEEKNLNEFSLLMFSELTARHSGEYTCRVSNHAAVVNYTATLSVKEPPAAPRQLRLGGVGSRWVRLVWTAPPAPPAPPASLVYTALYAPLRTPGAATATNLTVHTDHRTDSEDTLSATLEGLRPAGAYSLRLTSANHVGQSPHSDPLMFTTLEEVEATNVKPPRKEAPLLAYFLSPLPNKHFCNTKLYGCKQTPPQDSWNGELLGYVVSWREIRVDSGEEAAEDEEGGAGGAGRVAVRGWSSSQLAVEGLRSFARYALSARAYNRAGAGPHSPTLYATTADGVPEAVERVRALAASAAAVRVCWLPPAGAGRLTHYTLYSRERAKVGGEWVQRVDVAAEDGETETWQEEVCREVRGLRESTVYELWVRAANAASAGPPSRPVAAAPAPTLSARISSFSRVVSAAWGARVRLRCSALGAPPLRWRWAPLPTHYTVTDDGDLIIHKAEASLAGNYTCTVRNGLGSDSLSVALQVRAPPAPPAPRLRTTAAHALQLSWDKPNDGGAHILGN
ncbi:unnamed protein product [Spodoptera exigua]|nr:unnamed protein product [Spodoptera exigua]